MNKFSLLSMIVICLVACHGNQPVSIVKVEDRTVVLPKQSTQQVALPVNIPSNVTAICRDGSYSTALENICAGKGGVATKVHRYHAE